MQGVDLSLIFDTFGTLGVGGIFLYLYFTERNQNRETMSLKDSQLLKKDSKIEVIYDKVLEAFKDNTRVITDLRHSIDRNTEATKEQGVIIDSIRNTKNN